MVINDIKFNTDLETILVELRNQLSANNISLLQKMKPTSTHVMVQCPYHSNGLERKPSAGIRKSDGILHCFACGEVHTLPEVISHCFGHDEDLIGTWGWQWLLRNFATVEVEERKNIDLNLDRPEFMTKCLNVYVPPKYVSNEELDKYRYTHPYMYKRGLTDEVIEMFDIGYDRDMQAITFPVRDIHGNCLFIARRSVNTKFFNYPEGVEKPLYGLYELYHANDIMGECKKEYEWWRIHRTIIVCESMLDALSFWTVGKNAVALNGLGSEIQFKQLRELPVREIILATDMDERGLAARERIRKNMQNTKIIAEYFFPEGRKDANDCTKEELLNLKKYY